MKYEYATTCSQWITESYIGLRKDNLEKIYPKQPYGDDDWELVNTVIHKYVDTTMFFWFWKREVVEPEEPEIEFHF